MSIATLTRPAPAATPQPIRLGDLLIERGVIDADGLTRALQAQKTQGHQRLLGEVIVQLGLAGEEQVLEVLASAYGVPFARISPKIADPKVIEVLPREFLEKQGVLPLFLVRDVLTLAVPEPANVFLVEEVERITGYRVQIVAATSKDIASTLQNYLPDANVFIIDDLVDEMGDDDLALVEQQIQDLSDLEACAEESPIIKLANYLIYSAVKDGASDIHIEPGERSLRVRNRIDGVLYVKMTPPYQMLPAIVSRLKIMAGLDISERRMPQDGGIKVIINKRPVDLRLSTIPGKFGEKVVMRIVDTRNAMTGLEQLGFSVDMLTRYRTLIQQPNGVVLVTGPTGSGKSTTLYATLNAINDDAVNICTVEDPVEFNLKGVNQFQTNDKAGFTFASALRSLLRQDPDIIMVGEIRDTETGRIATQAALTGHLVLSTLHTNDAPSAMTRLFNIGVEPYLVAAAVRGVLAQRLVRKVCTHCKEITEPPAALRKALDRLGCGGVETFYHGTGCTKCRQSGYAGRLGVYELFIPSEDALEAVSRGVPLQELRKIAHEGGYTTLVQDGVEKVRAGLITVDELFRATAG